MRFTFPPYAADQTLTAYPAQFRKRGSDVFGMARSVFDFPQPGGAVRGVVDDQIVAGIAPDRIVVVAAGPGAEFDRHRIGLDAIADRLPLGGGYRRVIHGSKSPSQKAL